MSDLVATLRAIVRHELGGLRLPELGVVTEVFARDSESAAGNHQVSVRLQASGVELQRVPVMVGRPGLAALPNLDDLVLVHFLTGDLNAPVVSGTVYDAAAHPPLATANEVVYQPPDAAESGVRRLHLELPSGTTLTFDDDTVVLVAGGTEIEVARDGDVTVRSAAAIRVEAQADIDIEATGNLSLKATGDVKIEGATATLQGQAQATVKGPQVSLAGNTQFSPQ